MGNGWIGVDLDGTLARMDMPPVLGNIGPPVEKMVARIRKWIEEGIEVRIVTARVAEGPRQVPMIAAYLHKFVTDKDLIITCAKDYEMLELWDDLAVQIVRNTGERADGLD